MHIWHVQTSCYDRTGQLLGGGGMYIDAATPGEAERKAIHIEREKWGSPRMEVACHVTHVPGEGCTAYRAAGTVTA